MLSALGVTDDAHAVSTPWCAAASAPLSFYGSTFDRPTQPLSQPKSDGERHNHNLIVVTASSWAVLLIVVQP